MPICIECRFPVSSLYTTYSKADDRTLGKGVRLTQCPRCKRFADKYVEHDFVVLFIDLVLIKPQNLDAGTAEPSFSTFLTQQPIILQYVFFLLLCALETISFHLPIRTLLSATNLPRPLQHVFPHYPHPAVISTALLVSSFTKLFPLLLLIWNYDLPSSASAVSWAVIINNVAALEILLDCGYLRTSILAAIGAVCRALVGWGILRMVGVAGGVAAAGVVETGDLLDLWKRVAGNLGLG
ncbi:hypothetical protein H2203_007671 [Taxawa tesnikishii (nom. ined.)]|nr:hypothetical protein H2203_007671 [Dothideales sp. JES 119]